MDTVLGGVCLVVGGFFAIIGVTSTTASCRLWRRGVRAVAIVVGHENTDNGSYPVVEFLDANGTARRATLPVGDGRSLGSVVKVIYHPQENEGVQDDSFPEMFFIPCSLSFLGGAVLVISVLLFIGRIRVE